jgi:hypothetical protein
MLIIYREDYSTYSDLGMKQKEIKDRHYDSFKDAAKAHAHDGENPSVLAKFNLDKKYGKPVRYYFNKVRG